MNRRLFHGQLADEIAGDDRLRSERLRLLARSLVDIVREALIRDGIVRIHGFGTFRLSPTRARRGINPRTGEPIEIPARNRVLFRPAKALRDRIEPDRPGPVALAEPHESREACLGGAMGDTPVAGGLPATDRGAVSRSYFPDRVAAAAMPEPTVRVTGSAHEPPPAAGGGSREANLGGVMADSPSAGRVMVRDTGAGPPADPAPVQPAANDEGGGSREAVLGGASTATSSTAGALPDEEPGPDVQAPGRPETVPATRQGPERPAPAPAGPGARASGSREAVLGGSLVSTAPAGGLPEEGAPDVDTGRDWGAPAPAPGAGTEREEPVVDRESGSERGDRRTLLLAGLLLLLLLLLALAWWLWPDGDTAPPAATTEAPAAAESVEPASDSAATAGEQSAGSDDADETASGAATDTQPGEADIVTAAEVLSGDEPATGEATDGGATAAGDEAGDADAVTAGETLSADESGAGVIAEGDGEPAPATTGAAEEQGGGTEDAVTAGESVAPAPATESGSTADPVDTPWFGGRNYRIAAGDTLWDLSDRHYVNPYYWPHIWNHNRSLADPDRIEIDQRLWLPKLEGEPRSLTAADRRSIAEGYLRLYRLWQRTGAANPEYALVGVRYFDAGVMPPGLRDDPAAGRPRDALAAAFEAQLEAAFPRP